MAQMKTQVILSNGKKKKVSKQKGVLIWTVRTLNQIPLW